MEYWITTTTYGDIWIEYDYTEDKSKKKTYVYSSQG